MSELSLKRVSLVRHLTCIDTVRSDQPSLVFDSSPQHKALSPTVVARRIEKVLWCYLLSLHASLPTLCSRPLLSSLSSLSPVFFLARALDMTAYKCISDGVLWHMARKSTAHTSLIFRSV